MRLVRVVNVLLGSFALLMAPQSSAKVTYDGTGGVKANIFDSNSGQACVACHSNSWTRDDQSWIILDVYDNGTGSDAGSYASTANSRIQAGTMPYATVSYGSYAPLSTSEKNLMAQWITDGAVQNAAPEVATTGISGATLNGDTYDLTLNGTIDPSGLQPSVYRFRWGATSGSLTNVITSTNSQESAVGSGGDGSDVAVSTSISGVGCGTYYYELEATNATGTTTTSESSFEVVACNEGPTISTTSLSDATEDVQYQTTISATDPENDSITFSLSGEPSGMSINNSGVLSWTPDNSDSGSTFNFTVTATDADADVNPSDSQALSLYVTPVNDAPSIDSSAVTTATEDVEYSYTLSVSDDDDSSFTFSLLSSPSGMAIDSNGKITWTPGNGVSTSGSVIAKVEDDDPSDEKSDTQTFTISVTAVNDPPVYTSSAVTSATEDSAYSYDVDATDEENASLTYSLTTKPTGMTIDSSSGQIDWTPTQSEIGSNSVVVSVTDGNTPVTQSFSISVASNNDTPVIGSSAVTSATEGVAYSYDVDATDEESDSITYALSVKPSGMSIDSSSGVISWTPPEASSSYSESVTVTASDGNTADSQSFSISVSADNDTPTVGSSAVTSATESVAYSYDVDASDNENDNLTYSLTVKPSGMTIDSSSGEISWTPDEANSNYSESVTVSVSDGNTSGTQSFSITVAADDDAPSFSNSAGTTATESVAYSYSPSVSDIDDSSFTFALVSGPSGMTVDDSSGLVSWTPTEAYSDYSEAVQISVADSTTTVNQSFTINVTADNDTPVIGSSAVTSASESSAYSYDVNATDAESDSITYALTTKPSGMSIDSSSGVISWTPNEASSIYSESVTVTASDGNSQDSQSFTITVNADNDTPSIDTSAVTSAQENIAYAYDVDASDNENDSLTYSLTENPSGMSIDSSSGEISWTPPAALSAYTESVIVSVSDGNTASTQSFTINVAVINDSPSITSTAGTSATEDIEYQYQVVISDPDDNNNGTDISFSLSNEPSGMTVSSTGLISWTPSEGQGSASNIIITAADGGEDGASSAQETFSITVTAVNDAPEITSSAVTAGTESVAYTYQVTATDAENDTLTFSLTTKPTGMTIDSSDGTISWTPEEQDADYDEDVVVLVSDGDKSDSQSFTVNVSADNDAPVFTSSDVTSATEDSAYSYTLTAQDNENESLTYQLISGPDGMSLTTDTLSWTPPQALSSYNETVQVSVTDNVNSAVNKSFTITVSANDDAPVFSAVSSQSATEATEYTLSLSAVDPEGASVSYSLETALDDSSLVADSGVFTWTPPEAISDYDQDIEFKVIDDNSNETTLTVSVSVSADNDAPEVTSSDVLGAVENVLYQYDVDADDPEGSALSFSLVSFPTGMTIDSSTGEINWTPPEADANSTEDITVSIKDAEDTETLHSFQISVSADADTPLITALNDMAEEGVAYAETPAVFNQQNDTLTFTLVSGPSGMLVDESNGDVTWTPPEASDDYTEDVEILVDDGVYSSTYNYTISVEADDDAPEVTSTAITSTTENQLYQYDVNATDPEGDSVSFELQTAPADMTIDASSGLINWTAPASLTAYNESVVVKISGATSFTLHSFNIAISIVNDGPTITSSAVLTATEDLDYEYQVLVTDPDDTLSELSFALSNAPSGMTVSDSGLISWTPIEGQTDASSITVSVSDGGEDGAAAANQTFTITVTAVNDEPVITSSAATSATESVSYSYQVVVDDPESDTISYSLTSAPADMQISDSGLISWTPEEATENYDEEVTVTISDGEYNDSQSFTVAVSADNDAPVINSAPVTDLAEYDVFTYQIDVDEPESQGLTFSLDVAPEDMSVSSSGEVSWTALGSVNAYTESVTVNVSDGENTVSQSFELSVSVTNESPSIDSVAVTEATEDTQYQYQMSVSDPDDQNNGTDLIFSLTTAPDGMTIDEFGVIEWTPVEGQDGDHTVVVVVSDGGEDDATSAQQEFTVSVIAVNDGPEITSSASTSAVQYEAYSYQIEVEDPDDSDSELSFSLSAAPDEMTISETGLITWTPGLGQYGSFDVNVIVADGGEDDAASATQNFELNVTSVNIGPQITSEAPTSATEDIQFEYQVAVTDPDDDNNGTDLSFELTNAPEGMTVSSTGLVQWTPEEGVESADDVVITVSDGGESEVEVSQQSFSIEVTAVNDTPTITSEAPTAAVERQTWTYQVEVNDPDDDNDGEALLFTVESALGEALSLTSTGLLTWTPKEGETSSGEITVTVADGGEGDSIEATQSFTVAVTEVNQGPTLSDVETLIATEDETYSYQLVVDDPDDQNDGQSLTFELIDAPDGMSVSTTGVITWTPVNGVESSGEVTATVSDGGEDDAQPASISFEIAVTAVNDAPQFTSEPVLSATEDEAYSYDIEVSDVDNEELLVSLITGPENMSLEDNTLSWTPTEGQTSGEVTLQVSDGDLTATQSFTIEVTSVNDAPEFLSEAVTTAVEDEEYIYNIELFDAEGEDLTLILLSGDSDMSLQEQTLRWTPQQGELSSSVALSLSDGEFTVLQTFDISVTPVNDAPEVTELTDVEMTEFQSLNRQVIVSDVDSSVFSYELSGHPDGMTISSNGQIQWQSGEFSRGDYNITVTVDDDGDENNLSSTEFDLLVHIIDDDDDLVANYEDNCPAISNTQQLDFDADGVGDICDSDDDDDGMSDELETSFGLNPQDSSDAAMDLDSDGLSNLEEVQVCESQGDATCATLAIDSVPPVITLANAEVTVTATGFMTEVELSATAVDLVDGDIVPELSDAGPYRSGTHVLTWTASDAEANQTQVQQVLHILPLVRLSGTQVVGEDQTVMADVSLTGDAPQYPIAIEYEVSGTADSGDMTLSSGEVEITEGKVASIEFTTLADNLVETDESIVITLTSVTGAAVLLDEPQVRTITIVDRNVAPELELTVQQQELKGTSVYRDQGQVVVTANLFDANNDALTVTFTPDSNLQGAEVVDNELRFEPLEVLADTLTIAISVTDGQATTNNQVQLLLFDALPQLSAAIDSDNDGISDAEEGVSDSDNDRVPDYLDSVDDPTLLATESGGDEQALMQTTDGLQLSLGDTAAATQTGDALLSTDDITDENGETVEDEEFSIVGGVYDFEVSGLNDITRIANVVIPLTQAIPENAVYRKYNGTQWLDFVEDADNALASAQKVDGICPGANSDAYSAGLTAFDQCIRLTLSDGGPNDADGEVNGVIKDPGGIAVANVELEVQLGSEQLEVPTEQPEGGSGALGRLITVVLLSLCWFRRRKCLA